MNELLMRQLRTIIANEVERRGGGRALYDLGTGLVERVWVAMAAGQRADASPGSAPDATPTLASIWDPVLTPLTAGVADALEARITDMVSPTVKRVALASGLGGLGLGWTIGARLK